MGKIFNIAGPCNPERHYMLPATERVPEVMRLVKFGEVDCLSGATLVTFLRQLRDGLKLL